MGQSCHLLCLFADGKLKLSKAVTANNEQGNQVRSRLQYRCQWWPWIQLWLGDLQTGFLYNPLPFAVKKFSMYTHWLHISTRKYPRGIQKWVSTYVLPKTGRGVSWGSQNSKYSKCQAKICLNLNWRGVGEGEGGYSGVVKTQSAKSCQNFHFGGGGVFWTKSQFRVNWDFWTKISTTGDSYCITDSLSHTTYVETNRPSFAKDHITELKIQMQLLWIIIGPRIALYLVPHPAWNAKKTCFFYLQMSIYLLTMNRNSSNNEYSLKIDKTWNCLETGRKFW